MNECVHLREPGNGERDDITYDDVPEKRWVFALRNEALFNEYRSGLVSECQAPLYPDPDDEAYVWTLRSYDLGRDKLARDTILCHAVACEMPIYPSAPVVPLLLDPFESVMLHVYDDRGMDVIAFEPAKLHEIHTDFADWLLDHDRERMKKLF